MLTIGIDALTNPRRLSGRAAQFRVETRPKARVSQKLRDLATS